jgi:sulfur relay (sulfurtransferase) DsrC/TusE family protein
MGPTLSIMGPTLSIMGNCCTAKKTMTTASLKATLTKLIEERKTHKFVRVFRAYSQGARPATCLMKVDEYITNIQGVRLRQTQLSALAYAIRLGRVDIVRYLIEEAESSLGKVAEELLKVGKTPLDIICESGHVHMLKYLLPKLVTIKSVTSRATDSKAKRSLLSLEKQPDENVSSLLHYTAVQEASQRGHFSVVKYLYTYYQDLGTPPPQECDLHYIEENSGENCALLAAKSGCLQLLQFLHTEAHADFSLLNKRQESALQLAVVGSKRLPRVRFLPVIKFLCEDVGLNVMYEYEETLLLAEDTSIVGYLERQLASRGISVTKGSLEMKYMARHSTLAEYTKQDQEPLYKGKCEEIHVDLSAIEPVELGQEETPVNWSNFL